MRAALVDPSLFTLPYDVALVGGLRAAGVQVDFYGRVLTREDGEAAGLDVEPCFYRVAGHPALRSLPAKLRLAVKGVDHLASMRRLLSVLRRVRPDVIHFQWLPLPLFDARLLPAFRRLAPVVLTVHDTDPFNGAPTARLQRAGFAASLAGCDRLIVHTAQGAGRLAALGVDPAKVTLMPHGPLASVDDAGPDDMLGELTFVLFGKIKPYKGADLLVEAFAALPEPARWQARLRVVGQPYMELDGLRALAASRGVADRLVLEPRFVAEAEMVTVFAPGSVAVFPYREIEASGVLSLALAHGRPVIASRLGNFAETLHDGMDGRLVIPGDVAALRDAMLELIEDRALAAERGRRARALAGSLPGWAEIGRRTRALYEDVYGRAGPATTHAQRMPELAG